MIQLGRFYELGSGVINIHKYLPAYSGGADPLFEDTRDGFFLTLPLTLLTAKVPDTSRTQQPPLEISADGKRKETNTENYSLKLEKHQISVILKDETDYISLTDMTKGFHEGSGLIGKWITNKNTLEYLGTWERISNPAFHFAMWLSPEFQIYLVKEFQRLQEAEQKQLGWDVRRNLTKINYRIHTDAIRAHLIPPKLTGKQISLVYANEADVLNMALFGMTAKDWRKANPGEKGNIRDQANTSQLVCLANLENLNTLFINEAMPQAQRLQKLNRIAIEQMEILTSEHLKKIFADHELQEDSVIRKFRITASDGKNEASKRSVKLQRTTGHNVACPLAVSTSSRP